MDKVNILGTEYEIITDDSIVSQNVDGLCKSYDKQIIIRSKGNMLCADDSDEVKALRYREVLRHELVHAFFDEAGLDDYSNNEQLVTWIASMFPKMVKAFAEADCMEPKKLPDIGTTYKDLAQALRDNVCNL